MIPALEYEVEVTPEDFERLSQEVRFDFDAYLFVMDDFPKKIIFLGVASVKRSKINLKQHYRDYLNIGYSQKL